MRHVTQIFSRKALSIICALAIMLSCVSVGFSAVAETPADAAQYIVDADKSPAIPMFAGTKIDLNNVSVLFKGDEAAIAGADITWTLGGDYGQNLILGDDNSLTALLKGNEYKITATAGEKEAVLWVVVANEGDSSWDIYTFDFDEYAAEKQLDKLTFEADGGYRSMDYSYSGKAIYRTGAFKYNGAAFNQNSIPDAVKPIEGWSAWYRGFMNANQNGVSNYIEIPFLMPYKHSGTTGDLLLNREVSSGVMPFDNPYMTGALGLDNDNQLIHSVSNGLAQMKGFYVLDNEVVNSFMDYTVTADMDMTSSHGYNGIFNATGYNGVFGRLQTDAAGNPSTTVLQNYTSSNFINISWNNVFAETAARTDIANVLFGVNIYAPIAGNQYHRGASVGKIEINKNAQYLIVTDVAGCDAKDYIGEKYALTNGGGASISVDNWDYIKSKGYLSEGKTTAGVNVVMSVKYAGSTATVFSPVDATESFAFNNVPELKGNVGVWAGNITVSNSRGEIPASTGNWINLHSFKVSLNNDITAVNDGSEYPVYYKYYYQPVVDATAEDGAVNAEKNEITFTTISAAIDYLDGKGGKVWVKGDFSVDTSALEGTITPRKAITIAGYGDDATAASITITSGEYNAWMKGDITFDDITFSQDGTSSWRGLHSNGYVLTFESGVVTSGNEYFATESNTKDQNLVIKGGTFASFYTKSGNISYQTDLKANTNILLDGGYIKSVFTGTRTNYSRSMNFIGDFNLTVKSGKIDNFYFYGHGYRTLSAYAGDSFITVNGGIVSKIRFGGNEKRAYTDKGLTVTTGNSVAIVDESKLTSDCQVLVHDTKTHYNPASGKKWIAIFNNAGANNYATWGDNASFLDYRIETYSGKTTPVFEREEGKPETSTLVGFTITAGEGNEGKLVVVNGTDIIEAVDGLYDLSAYEDKGLIKIEFKAPEELEDTKEVVTDSSVIADYISGLVPEKEGYLFGGFMGENGNALKADEIANAESLTVKFIPKAVLDVKWQVRDGKAANTVDLRLITTLDSTQYKRVIFKVAFDGKEKTVTSRVAYKTIEENVGSETFVRTASEVNSAASEYVVTHVLFGIPDTQYSTQFVVTAMYETLDGKVIEGDATTIVIDKARTAQ